MHAPERIPEPATEQHPHGGDWLREIVFGLNDGLVTTLVFIMAISAFAPAQLALIALGEILAGGISMALGGYLAAQTTHEVLAHRIATEHYEIVHEPEEERAELRAIYHRKGFRGPLLDRIVNYLTADEERWLRAMVHDELGVVEGVADTADERRPWLQGMQVGVSFVVGGIIPAIPVLLALPGARWWAYGLTALTALALGGVKARYTRRSPVRAGLEFLLVVTLGMLAGLGIGLTIGLVLHRA
jgi:VIT1/CCC1 family predicted Fe2+/Mn2+ transporter